MTTPKWEIVVGGVHRWEPREGTVYTCTKVSARGKRHFARLNGTIMGTPQSRVFYDTLERCKELCEKHWNANNNGGEAP